VSESGVGLLLEIPKGVFGCMRSPTAKVEAVALVASLKEVEGAGAFAKHIEARSPGLLTNGD
jgi:hypothetical protein